MNKNLPSPLNTNEAYMYGINQRLEVLIDQMSSLLEHIASKDSVSVESARSEQVAPTTKRAKRGG